MKKSVPSATALVVAKNIALVAATPGLARLVNPEAARLTALLLRAYSPGADTFLRRVRRQWFRSLFRWYERCTIPGLALHQALRKCHIERIVRASLAEGFQQVVVLGGGLDTLALRLHKEFPAATFLELDHPDTQGPKRRLVEQDGLAGDNLALMPVDLTRQSLTGFLSTCQAYQHDRSTVFLSEGVLMYLSPQEVDALFGELRGRGQSATRFVFTFMDLDRAGRPAFHNSTWLVRLWLRFQREPFKWGLARAAIRDFVEYRGFSLKEVPTEESFRTSYLSEGMEHEVSARGEFVCVANRQS